MWLDYLVRVTNDIGVAWCSIIWMFYRSAGPRSGISKRCSCNQSTVNVGWTASSYTESGVHVVHRSRYQLSHLRCLHFHHAAVLRVAEKESINKMSLHNLATVFGPTLLRPSEKDSKIPTNPTQPISMGDSWSLEVMAQVTIMLLLFISVSFCARVWVTSGVSL